MMQALPVLAAVLDVFSPSGCARTAATFLAVKMSVSDRHSSVLLCEEEGSFLVDLKWHPLVLGPF